MCTNLLLLGWIIAYLLLGIDAYLKRQIYTMNKDRLRELEKENKELTEEINALYKQIRTLNKF